MKPGISEMFVFPARLLFLDGVHVRAVGQLDQYHVAGGGGAQGTLVGQRGVAVGVHVVFLPGDAARDDLVHRRVAGVGDAARVAQGGQGFGHGSVTGGHTVADRLKVGLGMQQSRMTEPLPLSKSRSRGQGHAEQPQ